MLGTTRRPSPYIRPHEKRCSFGRKVAYALLKTRERLIAALSAIACLLAFMPSAYAQLGETVENIATINYAAGQGQFRLVTSPAVFRVEARRTPSTIEFFRISPAAPDARAVALNGSAFFTGGDDGVVETSIDSVTLTSGQPVDLSTPVMVAPATAYFAGEPIIVRVEDIGQNGDPNDVDTIIATVTVENGDAITLRLFESGPNTGEFFAFVQSTANAVDPTDGFLAIRGGGVITARYQDPFDATEVSTDVAGVDPFGRIFDSASGDLLDGVRVTIIDTATGAPAPVFGADGVSPFPSTVITGSTVTDASGFVYELEPGEFRFPIMFPGEYQLIVETPEGFTAPSVETEETLQSLPTAPFTLLDASFGGSFILDGTGDVSFDVPLDPQTDILVTKEASAPVGAVGEFVRYEVVIDNQGQSSPRLRLVDTLPRGFRYQEGSARLNGTAFADPAIQPDGRVLRFEGGLLPAGESLRLTYVVEIGPGTEDGEAINRAVVVNGADAPISNTAEAVIDIRDDFLRNRLTIVGRIAADACDPAAPWPREIGRGVGAPSVRLYMETGAFTTTDEDGLYNFSDVDVKTHVVQIDTTTIPEGYEAVQCEENTRFAGSAISQFVDAQGGAVWRANFYLRKVDSTSTIKASPETAARAVMSEYASSSLAAPEPGPSGPNENATPPATTARAAALDLAKQLGFTEQPPTTPQSNNVTLVKTAAPETTDAPVTEKRQKKASKKSRKKRRKRKPKESRTQDDKDIPFNVSKEYLEFDKAWLETQAPESGWAYPGPASTPSGPSMNFGFRHHVNTRVSLMVNGRNANSLNFAGRDVSRKTKAAITRWRSVDLLEGDNVIVAIVSDLNGDELERHERVIAYVERVEKVKYLPEKSTLVADGRVNPIIAFRATDAAGRPVHAGRLIEVAIEPPHRSAASQLNQNAFALDDPQASTSVFPVGQNGVVEVALAPIAEAGLARLSVDLDKGRDAPLSAYLKPATRDWIVVGLAEGSLAGVRTTLGDPNATPSGRDLLRDGRAAVFAKGSVKGDWLITLAADTDKRRGDRDTELFEAVDPDDRFALLGDRSNQGFEAQSQFPIYLKAEKDSFQALLGDYDTNLSDSRLSRYSRRFSGVRAGYEGRRFQITGFAADTNQFFARDEIGADGTSGPFRLTNAPLVRLSESIVIETRDRFRPDVILSSTPLVRFLDYDIDFTTGVIVLRLPVSATDDDFNPNVLVVDYETSEAAARDITAGGRVAAKLLGGRATLGATLIHEGGDGRDSDGSDLVGADFHVAISDATELRIEYAASRNKQSDGTRSDDAVLAEVLHVSENVSGRAFFEEVGPDFGLGQQTSGVAGVRRFGADASVKIGDIEKSIGKDGERVVRGARFVDVEAYREENLTTGASRNLAEISVRQEDAQTSGSLGVRWVEETPVSGDKRTSVLATASAQHRFEKVGLTLRASRDQPIGGDDATLFPARTIIGADQDIAGVATLSVSHEIQNGGGANGQPVKNANTIVGVTAQPWKGGRVSVAADRITQDSSERIGATFGVDQQVRLTEKWSTSFGVSRREDLVNNGGEISLVDDIVPDAPISPFDVDGSFTSYHAGLGYRAQKTTASARLETRNAETNRRFTGVLGAAREVTEVLSFAGAGRFEQGENRDSADTRAAEARFGAAWRPRKSDGVIVFNRLDVRYDEEDAFQDQGALQNFRIVNNLALNAQITERLQTAFSHGIKYAELETNGQSFNGVTQLVGLESRYDIKPWLDIGFRGSALYSHNSNTLEYSYGPSVGVNPADNLWVTIGYNFEGFDDPDFQAAEFSREGPFVQLRIKIDQNTAKGLLDAISPARSPRTRP